tara:strand:+ start:600 stop:872 length:273 start_codon:yes stop_codon:yes gene_type:complete
MNNYRLTVHIENAERTRVETGKMIISKETKKKVAETKVKLFNTLSFYCKSKAACQSKLSEVRSKYTIAKGKDHQKMHKYDKELYNISFVN